jgi:galactokinase
LAEQKITVVAPARVNLLGEHTDYTGGYVMPMAIPFETRAAISAGSQGEYRFTSALFAGERAMTFESREAKIGSWSDYPVGVLRELQKLGIEPPAFVLELTGNVPFGAGLSSSASVEVAACLAMLAIAGERLSTAEVATLCQRAENQYVESPCGIMDQFVIAAGRKGHALMLNTRDLTYELVPMDSGGLAETCVVVCNSEVKHSVAAGEYGARRKEAEEAQAAIRKEFAGVRDLGDSTITMLASVADEISKQAYKRAHHIISENGRVLRAKEAMMAGDARAMGSLMVEAHASQRDDFECSCEEIDFLVDRALSLDGCFGARMTGGGFGGCTVNLVERSKAAAFSIGLKQAYHEKFGIAAETWVCEAVDGAMARNGLEEGGR